MNNSILRYLPEYSKAAEKANDSFDGLVSKGAISEGALNREEFIKTMVDIENSNISEIPDRLLKLPVIKEKIIERDPVVKSKIDDLIESASMSKDKAPSENDILAIFREAQRKEKLDFEVISEGYNAFDAEVKNGKIRDVGDNRDRYIKAYFFASEEGVNQDILRLGSIKNRVKKETFLSKAQEKELEGKSWGMSDNILKRVIKDIKAARKGEESSFTYTDNVNGEVRQFNNPAAMLIREAHDTTKDKHVKDLYSLIEEETAIYGATIKEFGETDFRDWNGVDDISMIFNSLRHGDSGMNNHVKMSPTQHDVSLWFHNSDIQSLDFDKIISDPDRARRLNKVQEIMERRIDENHEAIDLSNLSSDKKKYLKKKSGNWLTSWTKPEPTLLPLEINLTNIGRAVDRLETPNGQKLMSLARDADEVKAVEEYLGTNNEALLAPYDHIRKVAEEIDMAQAKRVSLEHEAAVQSGQIGRGSKTTTPEELKLRDEMEGGSGADETIGEIIDENVIPTNEYAVFETSFLGLSDPEIRAYLDSLPPEKAREALRKNAKLFAKKYVDAVAEASRSAKYNKEKRFHSLKRKAQELIDAKKEQKTLQEKGDIGVDVVDELFDVKRRISRMEKRPYKSKAFENRRYQSLTDRGAIKGSEGSKITKKFKEGLDSEKLKLKAERKVVLKELEEAKELGDLKENAAYHQAKDRLGEIDKRRQEIDNIVNTYKILPDGGTSGNKIGFGDTVTLEKDGKQVIYRILSKLESDPGKGLVSVDSPLGREVMKKQVGDTATINIKGKSKTYKIVKKN
jgi:transcription elongation factor GreA